MIGIINMQTNNIQCFIKILIKLKYNYVVINSYNDYNSNIDKLIIPGIGNYSSCMDYINKNKLKDIIIEHLYNKKKIMGICIGMQIFTTFGEEGGIIEGLNIFKDSMTGILKTDLTLPHIGWNNLLIQNTHDNIFKNVNTKSDFYFVHSYNVVFDNNENKLDIDILATTKFGEDCEFISIIKNENVLGIQFHPEKSGPNGIQLIKNFLEWI